MTSDRGCLPESARGAVGLSGKSIEVEGLLRFIRPSLTAILGIILLVYMWLSLDIKMPFLFFLLGVPLGYIVDRMTLQSASPYFFHQLAVKEIQRTLASKGEVRVVIDACCGEGYSTIFFAKYFPNARIIAIDKDGRALEKARKMISKQGLTDRISLIKADLEEDLRQLRFNDEALRNSADAVICQSAIYLFKFPEAAVRNLSELLVDGGVLFVSDVKRSLTNTPLVSMLIIGCLYFILHWFSVAFNNYMMATIALILLVLFGLHLGMAIPLLLGEYHFYTKEDLERLLKSMGFTEFSTNEFLNMWYFTLRKSPCPAPGKPIPVD